MREISKETKDKLSEEVTNFVLCWRILRLDGREFCFTETNQTIIVNWKEYSALNGFNSSAIQEDCNFGIDNLEIDGILNSDAIKAEDILAGLFDNSLVEVFMVDLSEKDKNNQYFRTIFLNLCRIGGIKLIGDGKYIA